MPGPTPTMPAASSSSRGTFRKRRCGSCSRPFARWRRPQRWTTPLLPDLADHGADDVGIVVGPYPLIFVRLLQQPAVVISHGVAEVVVAARHRTDGRGEFVVGIVLVG